MQAGSSKSFLLALSLCSIAICCVSTSAHAQPEQDLLAAMAADSGDASTEKEFAIAAFKATRVINQQSLETIGAGVLDFRILHRFGRINSGPYELFGLDQSRVRLSLDYGLTDRLQIGIGRSSQFKEYDGSVKYRLIWQRTDKGAGFRSPVSVVYVAGMGVRTDRAKFFPAFDYQKDAFTDRLSYWHQIIIGRKFSSSFSAQIAPTLIHLNAVPRATDDNDLLAMGFGARAKVSKRISLNVDYVALLNKPELVGNPDNQIRNSLSLGVDIETGGHVFQLHFTNSLGMNERAFMTETTGNLADGDIHYGFNISRVFTIRAPKEFR